MIPSNIQSFNPANKAPFLHHARQASVPSPSPAINVNTLTSILLIQMLTQSGLLSLVAGPGMVMSNSGASTLALALPTFVLSPQTPTQQKNHGKAMSSLPALVHSPSHLTSYLEYTKECLGVKHALTYKSRKHVLDVFLVGGTVEFFDYLVCTFTLVVHSKSILYVIHEDQSIETYHLSHVCIHSSIVSNHLFIVAECMKLVGIGVENFQQ